MMSSVFSLKGALPPYSPECNPAEHIWEEICEKWLGNLVFASLDNVQALLAEALFALEHNEACIQSLTGFEWVLVSF